MSVIFKKIAGRVALVVLGAVMFAGLGRSAQAVELLMFESSGCTYCMMWNDQLGGVYPKTSEGKQAPLRHMQLSDQKKMTGLVRPVRLTPTFVLMDKGKEIGRIQGYGGEDAFWIMLEELLQKADTKKRHLAAYKVR